MVGSSAFCGAPRQVLARLPLFTAITKFFR